MKGRRGEQTVVPGSWERRQQQRATTVGRYLSSLCVVKVPRAAHSRSPTEFSRGAFIYRRSFSSLARESLSLSVSFSRLQRGREPVEDGKDAEEKDSLPEVQLVITWSTQNGRIIALGSFVCPRLLFA